MIGWLATLPVHLAQRWRDPDMVLLVDGSPWGARTLAMARACDGMGEYRRNNAGPDIDIFRQGHGRPGQSWCAHFVSYCIRRAWSAMGEMAPCPIEHTGGARALWRAVARAGMIVHVPQPGDLALWDRGDPDRATERWKAHVGIVGRVMGERWWVIEGNVGPVPALVTEREVTHRPRFRGWARLPRAGA